jgi:hypothetical protein
VSYAAISSGASACEVGRLTQFCGIGEQTSQDLFGRDCGRWPTGCRYGVVACEGPAPVSATTMSTVFRLSAYADMTYSLAREEPAEILDSVIGRHAGVAMLPVMGLGILLDLIQ